MTDPLNSPVPKAPDFASMPDNKLLAEVGEILLGKGYAARMPKLIGVSPAYFRSMIAGSRTITPATMRKVIAFLEGERERQHYELIYRIKCAALASVEISNRIDQKEGK